MKDDNRSSERLVALFLFGMVLFNPLVVGLFDFGADTRLFGIPLLFLYLFVGWAVLIGLIAAVAESAPKDANPSSSPTRPAGENE